MTINASDIKLLESEVMADTTDGGGRRTSRVVPDGIAGNIFPKVSRLDSVYGRVNLRKVYGAVQTANTDTYAGAHAVLTDAPDNANIHTTLFSTGSEYDTRTAARDRIESYVTSGPESRMILLGRQLPGQQTFLAYQREEEVLPEVGSVYCLSNESGSTVTSQQYVRVQDVTSEVRTFEDGIGTFRRRVVTVDVGVALRYEFNGPSTADRYSSVARASRVRDTTVVDAARYFGIQKFAVGAGQNDLEVQVQSVYTPIVPTTNRETPIANENISDALNIVASRASTISESVTGHSAGVTRYLSRGIVPGSLSIGGVTDNKLGVLNGTGFVGTVDYETGAVYRSGGNASTSLTATYTPAAAVAQPAHTIDVSVDLNNRGTVYVLTLNPLPNPGSIIVDYRALGKWYRLRDLGDGSLAGTDPAYGVGTITYASGSLVLTLGALPDVDSSVIVSWGSPAHYTIRSAGTSNAATSMKQRILLPDLPISPDSVALTYTSGGVNYTATDNASGVITGDGVTGTVNYTTGTVDLQYTTRMPDASTNVAFTYMQIVPNDIGVPSVLSATVASGANMSLGTDLVAGSVIGNAPFGGSTATLVLKDNGSGLLVVPGGQTIGQYKVVTDQIIGTINYATGAVVVNTAVSVNYYRYTTVPGSFVAGPNGPGAGGTWAYEWTEQSATLSISPGSANWGWRTAAGSTNQAATHNATFTSAPLLHDLTTTIADHVVPGSVMFSAGGKTFIDRNGTLYADVSTTTGAGITAGSVNYATGEVSLSYWTNGAGLALSVTACLTAYGEHSANSFFFRTPGSPIRPGSLYIQATAQDGTLMTATSNENGVISGTKISGTVNQETGVVRLEFGQMVTAAGNESEPWYDSDAVTGGQIFKPTFIEPSTLTFNCVVLANLPLNADILGLDPVRLPLDGRVPIYRPADVVVIHNTTGTTLTNPVVAGSTYSAGRTNLAEAWLVDQEGTKLTAGQYAYDLAAGTVTMAADFTAGALVQPLILKHRVEDMSLLTDVQINGRLTLAAPLSRAYDVNSYVSSALLFGDMYTRVTNVFDLSAFSSWSDTPGAGSNAQYNNLDYPIEVFNNGGLTERWRINFTTTTAFQIIGENLGVIGTGSTASDCSPTNQLTGQPYFTLRAAGWGAGWSAGNQLRFNVVGAAAPIWIARTVLPGATLEGDSFSLQVRGDVDAE